MWTKFVKNVKIYRLKKIFNETSWNRDGLSRFLYKFNKETLINRNVKQSIGLSHFNGQSQNLCSRC